MLWAQVESPLCCVEWAWAAPQEGPLSCVSIRSAWPLPAAPDLAEPVPTEPAPQPVSGLDARPPTACSAP